MTRLQLKVPGHEFTLEPRTPVLPYPPLAKYRWRCSCGDDGGWRPQSEQETYLRWVKHAGEAK